MKPHWFPIGANVLRSEILAVSEGVFLNAKEYRIYQKRKQRDGKAW